MPQISVIIPLYNKAEYVSRALDSILSQSFDDFELIVVDDGSTDGSPDVVRGYQDRRLRLIQQENAGPGAARNRGVKEAQGTYVAFLDADDEWMPDYLKRSYETLQQHPECDVCVSSRTIKAEGKVIHSVECISGLIGRDYSGAWQLTSSISDRELEHIIRAFQPGSVFMSRQLYLDLGGYSEVNHFGEDWHLWIRLFLSYRIYFLAENLAIVNSDVKGICSQGLLKNPVQAYYIEADIIRQECPPDKRGLLERFYAIHALREAHLRAAAGNFSVAKFLVKHFPEMKKANYKRYLLLRSKLLFPQLYRFFRRVRPEAVGSGNNN